MDKKARVFPLFRIRETVERVGNVDFPAACTGRLTAPPGSDRTVLQADAMFKRSCQNYLCAGSPGA
ncbi:MAG: hypothetical protein ABI619_11170 [Betaproteobacteria bacterium]